MKIGRLNMNDPRHRAAFESAPLADVQDEATGWLIEQLDKLTSGRKARPVTEALILAELTKNPQRIRQLSREHRQALNDYFEQIDMQKLAGTEELQNVRKSLKQVAREHAPTLAAGLALGAALGFVVAK